MNRAALALAAITIVLLPGLAAAQASSAAVATSAAVGAAAGARASQNQELGAQLPLRGRELEDWKDPRTGASAHLYDQCGALIELRLSTVGARNYLWMKLQNDRSAPIVVQSNLVKARVGAHPWRRLASPHGVVHRLIEPGWVTWFVFGFDDKKEFAGARTIDVELPLEDDQRQRCGVRARMVRPAQVPEDARSSVVYTKWGVWLAAGSGLASTGGLERLGGAGLAFEIGFDHYPWLHHGFFLDLFVEDYPSVDTAEFQSIVPAFGESPSAGGGGPFLGYQLRLYPASWLPVSLGAAIGSYFVNLSDKDDVHLQKAYFSSMLRANVDGFIPALLDGSQFAVRLSSYAVAVPDGDFGPIELSGVSVGALLGVVVAE